MAGNLTSTLVVRLLDQVSGPARKAGGALLGLNKAAGSASGNFGARLGTAIERNNRALDASRGRLIDAAAGFYALKAAIGAPLQSAADFETQLEDIGQKVGIATNALPALGDRIKKVAADTNQATTQIASAVDALAGRGASIDVALAAADPIGKAATAYRAATDDLSAASWAAVDNLKVPADQIAQAIDMMAQAGKEGAFELKDMAQYFPALGAAYQGLGQKGVGSVADLAAALQVVRKGTGDASSAATNLQNVLQKIYAPATVKKFKGLGINIRKEMEKAAEAGKTPIEAIAEITNKALKGDLSKLGDIFEDAQVQGGMRALIQNMEEYRRIREKSLGARGVVDEDFERRIRTAQGAMDRWNNSVANISITLGTTLVPLLNDILDKVVPIVDKIGAWAAANPDLARTVLSVAGGLVAFKVAAAGLTFIGLLGRGGALSMLALGFNTIGRAAIGAFQGARGAIALQSALAALQGSRYTTLMKIGDGLSGIGRSVPSVSSAATATERLNRALTSAGKIPTPSIWRSLPGVIGAIDAVSNAPKNLEESKANGDRLNNWFEKNLGTPRSWLGLDKKPGSEDPAKIAEKMQGDLATATGSWHVAAQEGMRSYVQTLAEGGADAETKASQIASQIASYLTVEGKPTVDTADLDRALSLARQLSGALRDARAAPSSGGAADPTAGAVSGHRKAGGNVWPGGSFLVGDGGEEEIFRPKTAGTITPVSQAGGSVKFGDIIINGVTEPLEVARAVRRELGDLLGSRLQGAHFDSGAYG